MESKREVVVVYKHNLGRKLYRWKGPEDDDRLLAMHKAKMLPCDMAKLFGCSIVTIRDKHYRLGIEPHHKPQSQKIDQVWERTRPAVPDKPNPLEIANHLLNMAGSRFKEVGGDFVLDGNVVGLTEVIQATNRILKANGKPLLDASPAWIKDV